MMDKLLIKKAWYLVSGIDIGDECESVFRLSKSVLKWSKPRKGKMLS